MQILPRALPGDGQSPMASLARPLTLAALLLSALLAGCAAPTETATGGPVNAPPPGGLPGGSGDLAPESATGGTSGTSGGSVSNVAPSIVSFAGSASGADNSGSSSEVFTLTLFDGNGEKDFKDDVVTVELSGGATGAFTHAITNGEAGSETTEPATFGADGFKAWTAAAKHDGTLVVKFRYVYPVGSPAGTYTFTPKLAPDGGAAIVGPAKSTVVDVFSEITISPAPVGLDGAATATNWGLWTAAPGGAGAENVEGTNLVKLVNTGQKGTARVVIDFTESAFTSPDPDYPGIPIDNNIQFAVCELATSAASPSGCAWTYGPTSSSGSAAVEFTGLNKAIYVRYRIVDMPTVLPSGSYGASYTASEL